MNILEGVKFDIKDFFSNVVTYIFLFFALTPVVGVYVAYYYLQDKFEVDALMVLLAFGSFGPMFAIISSLRLFTKDISQETNILFMNKRKTRVNYVISKIMSMIIIGLFYGILPVISVVAGYIIFGMTIGFNDMSVLEVIVKLLLSYVGVTFSFGAIMLFISLFMRNSVFIYILILLILMLVPIVINIGIPALAIYDADLSELINKVYRNYLPISAATDEVAWLQVTKYQILMLYIYGIVFTFLSTIFVRRRDY